MAGVVKTMDQIDDGGAVNLSTGILTSFIEFAGMAANACGYAPEIRGMSDMPTGVHAAAGDVSKQRALASAIRSDFAEGVGRAIEHYERTQV